MTQFNNRQLNGNFFSTSDLAVLEKYCESIYIVGSFARGEQTHGSDIDIILLVRDSKDKPRVLALVEEDTDLISRSRPPLDLRIYTGPELLGATNGLDHFSLWSSIETGNLILGEEIQVGLKIPLVVKGILHWLDRANESSTMLETRVHFKECCFVLYSALIWFFFIEKLLLSDDRVELIKSDILTKHFAEMTNIVQQCYREVIRIIRKKGNASGPSIVRIKEGIEHSRSEYNRLHEISLGIQEYGNQIYRTITKEFGY